MFIRTIACLACLAVFAAGLPADEVSDAEAKADRLFEDGRKALFQGRYQDAVQLLRDAVDADKNGQKTNYRLHLARAYRYANQPEDSEKLLTAILKQSPDHVEAGQLLAEVYYTAERWQDLESLLQPLLTFRHDYPTYHMLAEATFNQDKYEDAREYYKEAIKLNPQSAHDQYQLANIYLAENRFALAANTYEQAIRLGLESSVLHYKLASAYFNLRNYFGRVSVVTVASGKAGQISGDWYLIEPVPGEKDAFRAAPKKSAIFQVATAIERGMEATADVQMLLANIYLNGRRYEQAYVMYQKLGEQIAAEDKALHAYYFAQSALGVGKYDEYLTHLKDAVKLDPESYESALVDAYLAVADKYNQAGKLDKYIEYLSLAVQQNPETSSLHMKLASALAEARQYNQAVEQWRMVLDLEPDHPQRTELLNLIKQHRGS
jgi:tetratricopeptide (TPR) repeat protein